MNTANIFVPGGITDLGEARTDKKCCQCQVELLSFKERLHDNKTFV